MKQRRNRFRQKYFNRASRNRQGCGSSLQSSQTAAEPSKRILFVHIRPHHLPGAWHRTGL
ncbi:hypothetical protein Q5H92_17805 [Hymenobacter sp. M29]|uniref:Uncharacterized protein n=1 Tax=Hymenobacter mellowenesis TaxID=3063995 RepID=A0ABT9AHT4_9BACT|nr:hypothetical protein [Hymenobacter sp. M29]